MSADEQLRPIGVQTGINWVQDHHVYLALLLSGIESENAAILQVFRDWDREVFDSTHSTFGGDGANEPELRNQDIDDAMEQVGGEQDNVFEENLV